MPPFSSPIGKFLKQIGDVIQFEEHSPLRLRKDMLTVLVYRLAATTFEPPPGDDDSQPTRPHESN